MPNWLTVTFAGVSIVSFKLAPVRALSLCWVKTSTCAKADNAGDSSISMTMQWRQDRLEKARGFLLIHSFLSICVLKKALPISKKLRRFTRLDSRHVRHGTSSPWSCRVIASLETRATFPSRFGQGRYGMKYVYGNRS